MILNIKYFGLITEITGTSEETYEFTGSSINDLLMQLISKYPELENKDFQVAQGMQISNLSELVTGHDIALLPPFSGG